MWSYGLRVCNTTGNTYNVIPMCIVYNTHVIIKYNEYTLILKSNVTYQRISGKVLFKNVVPE